MVIARVHHENSNHRPITLQSSSPSPNSNSRISSAQLPRSPNPNPPCLNHNFVILPQHRAITFNVRKLILKQTAETSLKDTARVPRPRPASEPSRRARRNSDLHTSNTAHNSCPSPPPVFNASYVFTGSGPLLHFQRDAREAPHKADGYVSSMVRRCLRPRLGYGIDG